MIMINKTKKPQDATLRNVRSAKKRETALSKDIDRLFTHYININYLLRNTMLTVEGLHNRVVRLEKWQKDVIGGGDFSKFNKKKK